jgi:hypothetical protein
MLKRSGDLFARPRACGATAMTSNGPRFLGAGSGLLAGRVSHIAGPHPWRACHGSGFSGAVAGAAACSRLAAYGWLDVWVPRFARMRAVRSIAVSSCQRCKGSRWPDALHGGRNGVSCVQAVTGTGPPDIAPEVPKCAASIAPSARVGGTFSLEMHRGCAAAVGAGAFVSPGARPHEGRGEAPFRAITSLRPSAPALSASSFFTPPTDTPSP